MKPKKAKLSRLEKAIKALPPPDSDFQKILNTKPGYRAM
jgi:hypothetical protein